MKASAGARPRTYFFIGSFVWSIFAAGAPEGAGVAEGGVDGEGLDAAPEEGAEVAPEGAFAGASDLPHAASANAATTAINQVFFMGSLRNLRGRPIDGGANTTDLMLYWIPRETMPPRFP